MTLGVLENTIWANRNAVYVLAHSFVVNICLFANGRAAFRSLTEHFIEHLPLQKLVLLPFQFGPANFKLVKKKKIMSNH